MEHVEAKLVEEQWIGMWQKRGGFEVECCVCQWTCFVGGCGIQGSIMDVDGVSSNRQEVSDKLRTEPRGTLCQW